MKKVVSLIFLLFISFFCFSQEGSVYLYNYDLTALGIDQQNHCAVQGNDGILYFTNNKGVLKYDGVTWDLINIDWTPLMVVTDNTTDNKIYLGCINNFGYLKQNEFGQDKYISLSQGLDSIGQITNIIILENYVFAYSSSILIQVSKSDLQVIKTWPSSQGFQYKGIFSFNNEIYINIEKKGLYKLNDNKLELINNISFPEDNTVISSCKFDNSQILIATESGEIYTFDGNLFKEFIYDNKEYVKGNLLSSIISRNDEEVVISTLSGGCLVINKSNGKKRTLINYQSGLPDDEILATCNDKFGGLWICHGYGISRADIGLPVENYSVFMGIEGNLTTMIVVNDVLYVATNEGLFHLTEVKRYEEVDHLIRKEQRKTTSTKSFRTIKTVTKAIRLTFVNEGDSVPIIKEIPFSIEVPMDSVATSTVQEFTSKRVRKLYVMESIPFIFKKIDGVEGKCKQLVEFDNSILVASNIGLYQVKGVVTTKILKDEYINHIYKSKILPGLIYVGTNKGVKIISFNNNKWNTIYNRSNLNLDVYSIDEDENNIWFTSANKVYKINKEDKQKNIEEYVLFNDVSENIVVKNINKEIQLYSSKGVFKYDAVNNKFVESDYFKGDDNLREIKFNQPDYTWIMDNVKWKNIDDKKMLDTNSTIFLSMFKDLNEIYIDKKNNIWTINENKLYKINNNKFISHKIPFNISFKKIYDKSKNLLPIDLALEIKYSNNAIYAEVSPKYFLNEQSIKYSYKVKGLDQDWSDWNEEPKISYPFLPSGSYILQVKAMNIFKQQSEILSVSVKISRPFWQAWWFYIMVVLFLAFVVYMYIKIRTRQLRKANEILEEKIRKATAEIRKQKDELEIAYNDIEQKNIHITESINYAQKIQEAILPLDMNIKKAFDQSFVYFKPRDIVSGDFYWFYERDDIKIIIAADCTGHGVPGAFMSMIGNTLLNQIIKEKGITNPSEILNDLDTEIIISLKQDQTLESLHDGMDISICTIHKDKDQIEFAGAKNPLYMIKNGEIEIIKGDRFSIGGVSRSIKKKEFTNNLIEITNDTTCYIFSDGYMDQIGGDSMKKFSSSKLKDLLLEIHKDDFKTQKKKLNDILNKWMGKTHQRDDILLIGFKVNPK